MNTIKRLYNRLDEWLLDLSQGKYAVCLGSSAGIGVLVVGLLLSSEFILIEALTMTFVVFGLEYVFGGYQPTEEG